MQEQSHTTQGMPSVFDLFCGAGGMAYGFKLAGYNVVGGLDIDPDCSYAFTHNTGAPMLLQDITETEPGEIASLYPAGSIRILAGCAPCQPYSRYSIKNVKRKGHDVKWKLVPKFADLVKATVPDIVTMENVPDLAEFEGGKVLRSFEARLRRYGYSVERTIVFCPDYGIPQIRRRLIVMASRFGKINLIPPTHSSETYRTVRQTISDLEQIDAGMTHPVDRLHKARRLEATNLKRIRVSTPGDTWEAWPEELKLECHKRSTGETFKNVYGRMAWDEPAPTITTQFNNYGTGRFGHPEQDRAISLREGALLQTFPQEFEFVPPDQDVINSVTARLIGNAVPVRLGEVIAQSITAHLVQVGKLEFR